MGKLAGRTVLITGSTKGIGRGIAVECAAQGAQVTVTGRTEQAGEAVVEEIRGAGGEAIFVRTDVTSESDIVNAVDQTVARFGKLDGLVCNAAAMDLTRADAPVSELDLDTWNTIIQTDLTSVFLASKYGIRAMLDGLGGSIVFISSLAAMRALPGLDAYTAAKGGMLSLTRSIGSYYARYDIRCNSLVVGFVDSGTDVIKDGAEQYPGTVLAFTLGRMGYPRDVATVAAHLLSDEAGYVNGATIPVDGGSLATTYLPSRVGDLPGRTRRRPGYRIVIENDGQAPTPS